MASPWVNTFATLPANGQDCWIRVPYYYGAPVMARFYTSLSVRNPQWGFKLNNNANGEIPFYLVPRWKPYP